MNDPANVRIRLATVADAATLAELARRLFVETFGAANTPENMRTYLESAFSVEKQGSELADAEHATLLTLDDHDTPIGYAMLKRGRPATGVSGHSPVELERIYLDKRWHGRGIADVMMARCIEQAHEWGADVLWLGVWQKNPRAISFYRRSGFATVAEQTFMLGDDLQMDFVMARSLR
jgi:diamine N-acetyltransferase